MPGDCTILSWVSAISAEMGPQSNYRKLTLAPERRQNQHEPLSDRAHPIVGTLTSALPSLQLWPPASLMGLYH